MLPPVFHEVLSHPVFILLLISGFIQLLYYTFFYSRIAFHQQPPTQEKSLLTPVSVVIAARNEAHNLLAHLPLILDQDYPDFEVIVVNDCSTDNSDAVLARFQQQYPHLRLTSIDENGKFTQGKKLALTVGIKAAQHEHILFTDADCKPASKDWIRIMQEAFSQEKEIVLGYGAYAPGRSLLNSMIRFDTFFIALQYLGLAKAGFPYMGVGRNLAYHKTLFFQQKGFATHLKLQSGDDDLFVNQAAKRRNTGIAIAPESRTISIPKTSINEWIRQKKRHLTTGAHYTLSSKLLIGGEFISRLAFYTSLIYLLINQTLIIPTLSVAGLRLLIQWVVFYFSMKRFGEKYLLLLSVIWDVTMPLVHIYCILSNKFLSHKSH